MRTARKKPLLGISMGDPGGIGPEICAKALNDQTSTESAALWW